MQRIVITSSCAAVLTLPISKPTVFNEENWNLSDIEEVRVKGNKVAPFTAYHASKTLAEKGEFFFFFGNILFFFGLPLLTLFLANSAAWDFYEQHKSEIKWDLTVINLPYVSLFFIYL